MRKSAFWICANKAKAPLLAHIQKADFHYKDYSTSVCGYTGQFASDLVGTPQTVFFRDVAQHLIYNIISTLASFFPSMNCYRATVFICRLKVIYKGFSSSCLVLYAREKSSRNHYVENRIRKFQLVHKLQRCFSSHHLFPARIASLEKSTI